MIMQDENSIEYLQSLKNKSRNRYQGKPHKPQRTAEVAQAHQHNHLLPYDVLMGLYLQAVQRLNAKGIRPLPHVPSAENELNEVWRCCLLGWASFEYFRQVLSKWELKTAAGDNSSYQQTMKF